jgi:predicted MFS family arabinose efflux permease
MSQVTASPRAAKLPGEFRYLWSASLIATLGDGVLVAAIPLMAQALTDDPQLIAGVAVATTAPWLLLSLVGGVMVDRYDRRWLMTWSQVAQAVLVAVAAALILLDLAQLWMLYVLAFGIGAAETLFTGASQAFVPALVGRDKLEAANGQIITTQTVSKQFAGPPLGAALFAFAMPLPFWLNAVTFAVSVVLIARIRPTGPPPRSAARGSVGAEIAEGLRWLARHRLPRVLTLASGAANFCEYIALSVMVLFATQVLGLDERGFGLLLGSMAIGGVIGGLVSGWVVAKFGGRLVAIVTLSICPLMWLGIGFFGRDALTVVAFFLVFSIAISLWSVVALSVRQRMIPDALLGRVTSASRMISFGAIPLGSLVGGYVAKNFGLIAPWIFGGALSLCVTLLALPALVRWEDH